jgi:DNA-binding transcriptional ArsR family regulator
MQTAFEALTRHIKALTDADIVEEEEEEEDEEEEEAE